MFYRPEARPSVFRHDPFKALVSPRPIAWVSTVDAQGRANLAPYSFFNAVGDKPPMLVFSSTGRKADEGGVFKDTLRNIEETGEFVVNLVSHALRDAMNASAAPYSIGEDEFEAIGLKKAPCEMVAAPRVAEAPASFECKLFQRISLPADSSDFPQDMVIGQVVGVHISDDVIAEGRVDVTRYQPLSRLGYMDYATIRDVFEMPRPMKAPPSASK